MMRVAARSRGWRVPLDRAAGRVVATTRSAIYFADGDDLIVLRDARQFTAGTHTSTSIVAPFDTASVSTGIPFHIKLGYLVIGDFFAHLVPAHVWTPPPARSGLASTNAFLYNLVGDAHTSDSVSTRIDAVVGELAADGGLDAVASLVGFGPGLTPAGDDALTGLFAVGYRVAGAPPWVAALAAAVEPLLARTTSIGAHQLRLAARGDFAEPVVAVTDAFATADSDALAPAVRRLQRIGATTGGDTLAGIHAALRLWQAAVA